MRTLRIKIFTSLASSLLLTALLIGCRHHGSEPVKLGSTPFSYEIAPSIHPSPDTRADGKGGTVPLAASADEVGVKSQFIANQVLIIPKNQQELDSFLARYSGTIIGTNAVPEPPARLGVVLDPKYKVPAEYLVRVDATSFDPKSFTADATRIGLRGAFKFSSEKGLKLMALITHEKASGHRMRLNYLYEGHGVLLSTQERPYVAPNNIIASADAFDIALFPQYGSAGSKANITAAWQWVQAHGIVRRTRVAIIDGGFWLDPSGHPHTFTCPPGSPPGCVPDGSDLPNAPFQRDIFDGDMFAGDINPATCTGGTPCPWHGNGSAGVAIGIVNNKAASAGTGGTDADPILFRTDISQVQGRWAIREAVAWGADVITMSYGGPCNAICRNDEREDDAFSDAANAGVVLVASAGNDGIDTGADNYVHPCINDGVICVGALADNGNTAFDSRSEGTGWASNYGTQVDIWAPTNIFVMADGMIDSLHTFSGTSASAPFVAGVTAMLKAISPALTSEEVRNLLRDTAWTDSPERETKGVYYVNALEAVKKASNYALPPDRFEGHSSTSLNPGKYEDLNMHSPTDTDSYRFATTGPTEATLKFIYSDALGKVGIIDYGLTADRACGTFDQLPPDKPLPNQEQVKYRVSTGNFSFQVGGPNKAAPYDLELRLREDSITPDSFEPDNELAQARDLGDGGYVDATLHTSVDVDYYKLFSRGNFRTMVLSMNSGVRVQGADGPIRLDVYDAAGVFYRTVSSAPDCSSLAEMTLPVGTWIVRVSGSAAGAYKLWMGSQAQQHPVLEIGALLYVILNPSGPVEFPVIEKDVWLAVEKRTHSPLQELELQTAGLHIRLLTENGKLIAEGRAKDFHGVPGESVLLPQSQSDSHYLAHVTRSLKGSATAEHKRLATISATLNMVTDR